MRRLLLAALALAAVAALLLSRSRDGGDATAEPPREREPALTLAPAAQPEPTGSRPPVADEPAPRVAEVAEPARGAAPDSHLPTLATLVVRVVSAERGAPIEGATVQISELPRDGGGAVGSSWPPDPQVPASDHHGVVELRLAAGPRHVLTVTRPSVGRTTPAEPPRKVERELEPLAAGEQTELTIPLELGPHLDFHGVVRSTADGAPIAGASVMKLAGGPRHPLGEPRALGASDPYRGAPRTQTDAAGRFELSVPVSAPGAFAVVAPGFGLLAFGPRAGHEARERACELALHRSASLRARVVSRGGSAPTPPAVWISTSAPLVSARCPPGDRSSAQMPSWAAECDADGWCAFAELPAHVSLDVELYAVGAERRIPEALTLEPGEARVVEWTVGGGARVRGVALDQDGEPAVGAVLWLLADAVPAGPTGEHRELRREDSDAIVADARTDDEGRFELKHVPPGRWWIGPRPELTGLQELEPEASAFEVPEGAAELALELRVERALTIRGRLLAPDGRLGFRGTVVAVPVGAAGGARASSGEKGDFVLGPLAPGTYELHVEHALYVSPAPRIARAGDEDVLLRMLEPPRASGHVVDASGRRLVARVLCSNQEGVTREQWTDSDGRFTVPAPAPGRCDLAAVTQDGQVGFLRGLELAVARETGSLELAVAPGGTLALSFEGERCEYAASQDSTPFATGHALAGRAFELAAPAGEVELEIDLDGTPRTLRVTLAPGERKELVVE